MEFCVLPAGSRTNVLSGCRRVVGEFCDYLEGLVAADA